jgi:hypothetical protein
MKKGCAGHVAPSSPAMWCMMKAKHSVQHNQQYTYQSFKQKPLPHQEVIRHNMHIQTTQSNSLRSEMPTLMQC